MMEINILKDDFEDIQIPYDEAVKDGRNLVSLMKDSQFELGQIADKLEPKYGDETLQRFSEDIGIEYGTLKSYRTTYKAWKHEPVRPRSFSVAKALNRLPDKAFHIEKHPDMTVHDAELMMQGLRTERSAGGKRRTLQSDNAIYKSRTQIVREIKDFLSDTSELTGMIWAITDLANIDASYLEEIVKALREASLRINMMIEIAFPKSKPDTVKDEAEAN